MWTRWKTSVQGSFTLNNEVHSPGVYLNDFVVYNFTIIILREISGRRQRILNVQPSIVDKVSVADALSDDLLGNIYAVFHIGVILHLFRDMKSAVWHLLVIITRPHLESYYHWVDIPWNYTKGLSLIQVCVEMKQSMFDCYFLGMITSQATREALPALHSAGVSISETTRWTGVTKPSVYLGFGRYEETGALEDLPGNGWARWTSREDDQWKDYPEITMEKWWNSVWYEIAIITSYGTFFSFLTQAIASTVTAAPFSHREFAVTFPEHAPFEWFETSSSTI